MKFDMHCHTQEGSPDGKIAIAEYVRLLKEQGFDGMLVTDHNSYNGFRKYRDSLKNELKDFVVLKGIEYDTIDAGHILVIMPENVKLLLLECRGLPVKVLQDIVHRHGGILGPAHPCGQRHLSFTQTIAYKKSPELIRNFDFLEGYNSCESPESNANAMILANEYGLASFGGSDSHSPSCVGTAHTIFSENITCESDLINYVKARHKTVCGGTYYQGTLKKKIGILHYALVEGFWFYNRFASIYRSHKRKTALNMIGM